MSERIRKGIGIGLVLISTALCVAGIFPLPQKETAAYEGGRSGEISAPPLSRLDPEDLVNLGDAEALTALPGIGPSIAEAVLREREENGPFIYPEDLISVKGIGVGKLEAIRPMLTILSGESED